MILEVRSLRYLIEDQTIVDNFSFYIREKGLYSLTCSQKNQLETILSLICGQLPLQDGEVILEGMPAKFQNAVYKSKILFHGQQPVLDPYLNVYNNLLFWAKFNYSKDLNLVDLVHKVLNYFQLDSVSQNKVNQLTDNEKLKISLLKASIGHQRLILFHNLPQSFLSFESAWLKSLIDHLKDNNKTILITASQKLHYQDQFKIEWKLDNSKLEMINEF